MHVLTRLIPYYPVIFDFRSSTSTAYRGMIWNLKYYALVQYAFRLTITSVL